MFGLVSFKLAEPWRVFCQFPGRRLPEAADAQDACASMKASDAYELIAAALSLVCLVIVMWPRRKPNAFHDAMRRYDEAISEARRLHRPVKHIIKAREQFTRQCLRGVK